MKWVMKLVWVRVSGQQKQTTVGVGISTLLEKIFLGFGETLESREVSCDFLPPPQIGDFSKTLKTISNGFYITLLS
jgi:hypothetical protein